MSYRITRQNPQEKTSFDCSKQIELCRDKNFWAAVPNRRQGELCTRLGLVSWSLMPRKIVSGKEFHFKVSHTRTWRIRWPCHRKQCSWSRASDQQPHRSVCTRLQIPACLPGSQAPARSARGGTGNERQCRCARGRNPRRAGKVGCVGSWRAVPAAPSPAPASLPLPVADSCSRSPGGGGIAAELPVGFSRGLWGGKGTLIRAVRPKVSRVKTTTSTQAQALQLNTQNVSTPAKHWVSWPSLDL